MGTYGICGVVWYLDFITDADGLIGDYFSPATTICNLATYPRTADCVWNTYQNCYRFFQSIIYDGFIDFNSDNHLIISLNHCISIVYRQNCGLIGVEWAALSTLKFTKTGTLLG